MEEVSVVGAICSFRYETLAELRVRERRAIAGRREFQMNNIYCTASKDKGTSNAQWTS